MIAGEIPAHAQPEGLPTIGAYPDVRDRFVAVVNPWLIDKCPPVKRIGFATALALPPTM